MRTRFEAECRLVLQASHAMLKSLVPIVFSRYDCDTGWIMKKSILGALALGTGAATLAGFGASAGRDLWKGTRRSVGLLLALGVLAASVSLPFLGARNLGKGHRPGEWWKIFLDIAWVVSGMIAAVALSLLVSAFVEKEQSAAMAIAFMGGSIAAGILGLAVGVFQRPANKRRHAVELLNESFLDEVGILETGETEITHVDAEGNGLRVIERTASSIVFMAVGKRNKRAYIMLSPEGRMLSYTGVVPLGGARRLDDAA